MSCVPRPFTACRAPADTGCGLGVVELTVALHHVFETPADRLLWTWPSMHPHKILTGRRERMSTIRQKDGLSGFTLRTESEYDPLARGIARHRSPLARHAVARDLSGGNNHVIAVIGDGAMSAGMAYEDLNNAGSLRSKLIVILNDNDMSMRQRSAR